MKTRWFVFGCLTSVAVVVLLSVFAFGSVYRMSKGNVVSVSKQSVLSLDLSGQIQEYSVVKNERFNPLFKKITTAHDIKAALKQAKTDDRIVGVLLKPQWIQSGYAVLHEIGEAIEDFKTSGKPVIAYMEMCGNKDYFLASYADTVVLNSSESGGILLSGVGTSILYYKDLFDKLGVDVQVIHSGQYKATGEQYTRNQMSEQMRESVGDVFENIYGSMIHQISENRNLSDDMLRRIYEDRSDLTVSGGQAYRAGLVDTLVTQDAISSLFDGKVSFLTWRDYPVKTPVVSKAHKIAVIYAEGTISPQSGNITQMNIRAHDMEKIIDDINADADVRAVVLRINSPGGSALESELIYQQLKRIYKPVVVSMANVAASGGYYISCTADYVFADPFVITGSIGVVSMIPNFHGLAQKAGVNSEQIKYGKFSVISDVWAPPSEALINALRKGSQRTYTEFKQRVATARGLSMEQVEAVAQGRIWSNEKAVEYGLVDASGTLEDALAKAAELAGITGYSTIYYPRQHGLVELLLDRDFSFTKASVAMMLNREPRQLQQLRRFLASIKEDNNQMIITPELYEVVFGDCDL